MPKKGGNKTRINADFTLNDSANAPKPVGRVKKSVKPDANPVASWEDLEDNEYDVLEEIDTDGNSQLLFVKKQNSTHTSDEVFEGVVYPEIVWYLISKFVKPEDVGKFALINKATYAITKRESFWRQMYYKYCKNHPRLPEKLKIENSFVTYGLRQRVIRGLFYTYRKFFQSTLQNIECSPHKLIRRRCVSVWYCKLRSNWSIFFKLKRQTVDQKLSVDKINFLQELGRVDANPDEGCKVLQVTCLSLNEVPPLMGMALCSVNVSLTQGLIHQRVNLGFTSGICNGVQNIVPERSIVIDSVLNMNVYDWWHPRYPFSDTILPSAMKDEELAPVLRHDFFTPLNGHKYKL
ncbi:transmembrane protein 183 [Aricia agestis]|uniref:transmembrane protein 183 n=1 Tax=Aricia agestis TaxID=91739 RepID=UPI001C20A6BC|nr:transmembrane protein 183 [Aricia agestis]